MDKNRAFTPPDGGYGWIIVLATTLINVAVLPLVQCFGIIFEKDFTKSGTTGAQTSFLLHLHSAIYCSLGLLGSPLLKKYDFRKVAILGTCLMTCGIFLTSFTKSYAVLICTFSILLGIGQGIMLPATYLATNTYFKKRLTLAVSFSVTGASISNMIMPHICRKLLESWEGTQGTVLTLAAISIVGIFCCFLLKPIKGTEQIKPQDHDRKHEDELLNEKVYNETTTPIVHKTFVAKLYELFDLELLKDGTYVVVIIGMSLSFASELNIILMLTFILPKLAEFNLAEVALAMSFLAGADVCGRLLIPLMGHYFKIPARVMYSISLVFATIGRLGIAFLYPYKTLIFASSSFIGLAKGTKAVYQSVIIPKLVPLEKLPAANGLNMLLTGITSLIVGTIIGSVHDFTHSYVYTLHTASFISLSCILLWILHSLMINRRSRNTTITESLQIS